MVQGGYVSQSNSKTLTVSKKNVLDKKPPKTNALHSSNNNNSTAVENSAPSVDVSTFYYWNFIQTIEHVTKKKTHSNHICLSIFVVSTHTGKCAERIHRRTETPKRWDAQTEGDHRQTRESHPKLGSCTKSTRGRCTWFHTLHLKRWQKRRYRENAKCG